MPRIGDCQSPPGGRTVRAPPEGLSEPTQGDSQSPQGEPRGYMREVGVPALGASFPGVFLLSPGVRILG